MVLKRRTVIALIVGLAILALGARIAVQRMIRAPDNEVPADVIDALRQTTTFELLSIEPARRSSEIPSTTASTAPATMRREVFQGFTVLGRVAIADVATRAKLGNAFIDSVEDAPAMYSACMFQPRHGFHLVRDGKTIDILICFHCGDVLIYDNEQWTRRRNWQIDGSRIEVFNDVLRAANIPLAD